MRFILNQALLLLAGTTALAAPRKATTADAQVGVYVAIDWDWGNREKTGTNQMYWIDPGQCQDLGGTPFDQELSSFGPEPGVKCVVFAQPWCQAGPRGEPFDALTIYHPGYARLQDLKAGGDGHWNDKIRSFRCEWGMPPMA